MKKIILKVLKDIDNNTSLGGQINLGSESAQLMIADKLLEELEPHVRELIENIVVGDRGNFKAKSNG